MRKRSTGAKRAQRQARVRFAMVAAVTLATGCVGPIVEPAPQIDPVGAAVADARLIVSDFLTSSRTVASEYDLNTELTTITTAVTMRDMSPEVAQALRRRGLDAVARSDVSRRELGDGEILVRGAIGFKRPYDSFLRNLGPNVLTGASLGVFGMWLPNPFGYLVGSTFLYRVEIVNGRGDILLSTGERIIDGYYRYHYWWSEVNPSSAHQERITEDIRTQVVEALADAIASRS